MAGVGMAEGRYMMLTEVCLGEDSAASGCSRQCIIRGGENTLGQGSC